MFCPFVNGNCVSNCVFCNNDGSCSLLKNIAAIKSNTGSDQTDSWYINNKLDTVLEKLDCIVKKLEQSVD